MITHSCSIVEFRAWATDYIQHKRTLKLNQSTRKTLPPEHLCGIEIISHLASTCLHLFRPNRPVNHFGMNASGALPILINRQLGLCVNRPILIGFDTKGMKLLYWCASQINADGLSGGKNNCLNNAENYYYFSHNFGDYINMIFLPQNTDMVAIADRLKSHFFLLWQHREVNQNRLHYGSNRAIVVCRLKLAV